MLMMRRKKTKLVRRDRNKLRRLVRVRSVKAKPKSLIATPVSPPPPAPAAVVPAAVAAVPVLPRGFERLTPTQRRVLQLIVAGRKTVEIAAELGASPHTVQAHRVHISVRLGLRGHNALQRFAFEHRALL